METWAEVRLPSPSYEKFSDHTSIRAPISVLAEMWSKLVIWAPPAPGLSCCKLHTGHKHGIFVGKFMSRKEREKPPSLGSLTDPSASTQVNWSESSRCSHQSLLLLVSSSGKRGNTERKKTNPLGRKRWSQVSFSWLDVSNPCFPYHSSPWKTLSSWGRGHSILLCWTLLSPSSLSWLGVPGPQNPQQRGVQWTMWEHTHRPCIHALRLMQIK